MSSRCRLCGAVFHGPLHVDAMIKLGNHIKIVHTPGGGRDSGQTALEIYE